MIGTYPCWIIMVTMDGKYWHGNIVVGIFIVHNRKPVTPDG